MKKKQIKKVKLEDIKLNNYFENEKIIETGFLPLDLILGGGIEPGITQIVGETSTGKTLIALWISLTFCVREKKVLFIDTKGDVKSNSIKRMSLEQYLNKNFYYEKTGSFSNVEEILDKFISTGEIDLIIIDSIAGLLNDGYLNLDKNGIKTDNNNSNYGSRPLTLLANKLKQLALENNICILFINEFRNKIDKRIGTLSKIFGPKTLQYQTNSLVQINEKISAQFADFKTRFEELEKSNIGVSLELEVIKSNNVKVKTTIPVFLVYGKTYSNTCAFIYALLKEGYITENNTYFSFEGLGIKVRGIKMLFDEIDKIYYSVSPEYKQIVKNFYNNLIIN